MNSDSLYKNKLPVCNVQTGSFRYLSSLIFPLSSFLFHLLR